MQRFSSSTAPTRPGCSAAPPCTIPADTDCAPPAGSCRRCRFGSSTETKTLPPPGEDSPPVAARPPVWATLVVDHDKLFTKDGWMRVGDICELDADGYLSVTGRTSDFIVCGGKNIGAVQVEDAVTTHPAIAVAAAVAMPDPIFGEKVCVYVELVESHMIDLPMLNEHLLKQGISKELLPERLVVVDELPRSSGGKIAKGKLREDIRTKLGPEHERT